MLEYEPFSYREFVYCFIFASLYDERKTTRGNQRCAPQMLDIAASMCILGFVKHKYLFKYTSAAAV